MKPSLRIHHSICGLKFYMFEQHSKGFFVGFTTSAVNDFIYLCSFRLGSVTGLPYIVKSMLTMNEVKDINDVNMFIVQNIDIFDTNPKGAVYTTGELFGRIL